MGGRIPSVELDADDPRGRPAWAPEMSKAVTDIAAILNGLPPSAMLPAVCSILISWCAAQDDPRAAFLAAIVNTNHGLELSERAPAAGTA